MQVTFTKTAIRRYGVHVQRDRAPDLWMFGPGYDDDLPHDLLHFVAEAEFGLDGGVFGDVAAGGNARIFLPVDRSQIPKLWRRKRMHGYLLPDGRRSEQLASDLEQGWHARTLEPRLLQTLDDLAERWHALEPGEALTLEWPRPEGRRKHPQRDRRRPERRRR